MENLKSYASYFGSFLIDNFKNLKEIEKIILFGSVSRNEAEKESDVDIFVETKNKTKKFKIEVNNLVEKFYNSREAVIFKAIGIDNRINIKIGELKDWKDLQTSISANGIILYGKYKIEELPEELKHYTIIFWDKIGKNRGAFLNKIYGFKVKEKYYPGIIKKYSGRKLGKSSIMIPFEYKDDVFKLLKFYNVNAKNIEIFA